MKHGFAIINRQYTKHMISQMEMTFQVLLMFKRRLSLASVLPNCYLSVSLPAYQKSYISLCCAQYLHIISVPPSQFYFEKFTRNDFCCSKKRQEIYKTLYEERVYINVLCCCTILSNHSIYITCPCRLLNMVS